MAPIVRYVPTFTTTPAAPSELMTTALDLLRGTAKGTTSTRALKQLTLRLDAAHTAASHIERIQQVVSRVTRESETCARDLAALRADIAEHTLRRAGCEFQSDQLAQERALLPRRIKEGDELATLRHRIAKARLQAELKDVQQEARRARTAPPATTSTTPNLDAERQAMEREGALTDARRIVEDITAEHVPTDARQPHHAYAGCVYLAARLDGASPADAAAYTRTVVADRIAAGVTVKPAERTALKQRYDELKARLDGAAKKRDGAFFLDALDHLGNGNGSQRPS